MRFNRIDLFLLFYRWIFLVYYAATNILLHWICHHWTLKIILYQRISFTRVHPHLLHQLNQQIVRVRSCRTVRTKQRISILIPSHYYSPFYNFESDWYTFSFAGISNFDGGQSSCKSHWADLTPEFRRKHYLVGLVLSHLSNAFNHV